jgi:hypothetical protein
MPACAEVPCTALNSCGMRVGIDFGTTHTVVAAVDQGNCPVVSADGVDAWPSVIAANAAGELRFGLDAAAVRHEPEWPYDPVLFPFGPALYDREDLGRQPVGRWNDGRNVEERYVVAPSGAAEVTLTTQPAGFKRTFRLERRASARLRRCLE